MWFTALAPLPWKQTMFCSDEASNRTGLVHFSSDKRYYSGNYKETQTKQASDAYWKIKKRLFHILPLFTRNKALLKWPNYNSTETPENSTI